MFEQNTRLFIQWFHRDELNELSAADQQIFFAHSPCRFHQSFLSSPHDRSTRFQGQRISHKNIVFLSAAEICRLYAFIFRQVGAVARKLNDTILQNVASQRCFQCHICVLLYKKDIGHRMCCSKLPKTKKPCAMFDTSTRLRLTRSCWKEWI